MAITVKHSKVSTIPDGDDSSLIRPSDWNDDHTLTGLGTMAEQNANNVAITGGTMSGVTVTGYIPSTEKGVANGVATLDAGGQIPISQIPPMGDLNYQGTWNATTNSPTLTSSVGTKGYYYVVSVAGTTNLNGITDWQIGDWAVYNGTAWQKIDNTDAVTSVNGYTGTVVLTYSDVGAANAPTNTNITSMTGITGGISSPDYIAFDTTYATPLTAGQLGWDGNNTLAIGMAGGNVVQHIGEDLFFYFKATSAVTKGQVVMFTGAVGASGVPTGAPATGITDGTYIMGIAAESVALNGFGLVQSFGELRNVNTSGYADGDILWYDPAVTGGLTKTKPSAPNVKVQMAAVINGGSSGGGTILIRIDAGSTLGGTDSNAQITTPTNGQILTYDGADAYWKNTELTAGTAISVSKSANGVLTVANTAPDQTVSITGGGTTTVTGTYPNFTVSSADQYVGTVTSVSGTGSVNGITLTGTVTSSGSLTLGGTLGSIANSQLTNSAITINGNTVSLGGSTTVTATATNALTIGSYLTGTSYNGSTAVTIAADATSANTVSKLVARDANGDFSAGVITATKFVGVSGGTF